VEKNNSLIFAYNSSIQAIWTTLSNPHKQSYFTHHANLAIYSKQKAIIKPQNRKYYWTKIENIES